MQWDRGAAIRQSTVKALTGNGASFDGGAHRLIKAGQMMASTIVGKREASSSGHGGEEWRNAVSLSNSQIEVLFALFKERENKDKLSGKNILPTDMMIGFWTPKFLIATSDFNAFTDLFDLVQIVYITLPDGKIVKVRQAGTVNLGHRIILKNVLYSPEFKVILFRCSDLRMIKMVVLFMVHSFILFRTSFRRR